MEDNKIVKEVISSETCKMCDCVLTEVEHNNKAYTKDKSTYYYLCNRCAKLFNRTRKQAIKFMAKDIFWME